MAQRLAHLLATRSVMRSESQTVHPWGQLLALETVHWLESLTAMQKVLLLEMASQREVQSTQTAARCLPKSSAHQRLSRVAE